MSMDWFLFWFSDDGLNVRLINCLIELSLVSFLLLAVFDTVVEHMFLQLYSVRRDSDSLAKACFV